jgi:hypothetical protein
MSLATGYGSKGAYRARISPKNQADWPLAAPDLQLAEERIGQDPLVFRCSPHPRQIRFRSSFGASSRPHVEADCARTSGEWPHVPWTMLNCMLSAIGIKMRLAPMEHEQKLSGWDKG